MPWVLDGSNLAGGRDRDVVRRAALALARAERVRLLLFFDGPPPAGTKAVEHLGTTEVRYVPDADAAIVAHLGSSGRSWIVATDDRTLAARAVARGARAAGAAEFWRKAARAAAPDAEPMAAASDLDAELAYFHDPSRRLPQPDTHIPRRRRPRR